MRRASLHTTHLYVPVLIKLPVCLCARHCAYRIRSLLKVVHLLLLTHSSVFPASHCYN